MQYSRFIVVTKGFVVVVFIVFTLNFCPCKAISITESELGSHKYFLKQMNTGSHPLITVHLVAVGSYNGTGKKGHMTIFQNYDCYSIPWSHDLHSDV